jgi:NADH:ubiquinone oxidoreductase subunit E
MAVETHIPEQDLQILSAIVADHGARHSAVLQILLDINQHYHYLPQESLEWLAGQVKMPISQIFSVATFFKVFSLTPRGRTLVHVCTGTACHVKGAPRLIERLEKDWNLRPGETTADLALTLETVNCVGACASAPIVRVNEETNSEMTAGKLSELIKEILKKEA